MAISGNSGTCTINGWQSRVSKQWYPTDGSWTAVSALPSGLNVSISSPNVNNSTSSSNNKYGVRIKITTPNTSGLASVNSVSLTFKLFKRSGTATDLFASLRSTDASDANDTTDTFRTSAIGDEAVITGSSISTSSTTPSTHTITFTGTMAKNTAYYIYLYTKNTNVVYGMYADFITSCSCLYTKSSYTVKYNNNGYGTAPAAQTKVYGESLTLKSAIANQTLNHYTVTYNANGGKTTPSAQTNKRIGICSKWNTKADGTGTAYNCGGAYTGNAALTLYAHWTWSATAITLADAITRDNSTTSYTVSYNNNGGTSTPTSQKLTHTTSYTFSKWSIGNAGANYIPISNVTATAQWKEVTAKGSISIASGIKRNNGSVAGYKVTFNANGGKCEIASTTAQNVISYSFSSWKGSDGKTYKPGDSYSGSEDLTLTAQWTSVTTKGIISLPTPTRDGYTFAGWATSATATSGATGVYTPTQDTTLYAVWTQDYTTVYYNQNGTAKEAQVWYNHNGNPVLCNVYYNNNGSAVQI